MMKKLITLIILICGICGFSWVEESKLNILTTTSDLKSIAEEVGGKYANITSICTGSQDPHYAEAKPSIIANARKADLLIVIGLELEVGYEPLIIEGARNPKIKPGNDGYLDVSSPRAGGLTSGVLLLEVPQGKVDRSMGDVHPYGNPHYWIDPYNARVIALNISNRLQTIDPAHKDEYQNNCSGFIKRIDEAMFGVEAVAKIGGAKLWELELTGKLDEFITKTNSEIRNPHSEMQLGGWVAKTKPLRGMKIVVFHRSWTYFANRFGLVISGEIEPKPGIPPGPTHIKNIIRKVNAEKIKVILMELFYNRKSAEFVADKTGARVVESALSVGGDKSTKDYIALIDNLINRLVDACK